MRLPREVCTEAVVWRQRLGAFAREDLVEGDDEGLLHGEDGAVCGRGSAAAVAEGREVEREEDLGVVALGCGGERERV